MRTTKLTIGRDLIVICSHVANIFVPQAARAPVPELTLLEEGEGAGSDDEV